MTEELETADQADQEGVSEDQEGAEEGQAEGQAAEAEGEQPAEEKQKETSKQRRERDKALKARLRSDREAALAKAEQAEARAKAIRDAGKSEAPPKAEDFEDDLDFIAAKAVYAATQKTTDRDANMASEEAAAAQKVADQAATEEKRVVDAHWQAQVEEAKTRYADFDQVVRNEAVPITKVMGEVITGSDQAADLAYAIASQPEVAAQIASMPPLEAARAIGVIEARLSAPKPRTTTNAPDPISPTKGTAGASQDPTKMKPSEYRAWRQAGGTF